MTKDEALKLALEALEKYAHDFGSSDLSVKAMYVVRQALAQLEQEPVGQLLENAFGRGQVMWFNKPKDESMLYTNPPQRTWVGLTDEEVNKLVDDEDWYNFPHEFAKAVEAKLKEKNI